MIKLAAIFQVVTYVAFLNPDGKAQLEAMLRKVVPVTRGEPWTRNWASSSYDLP